MCEVVDCNMYFETEGAHYMIAYIKKLMCEDSI